MGISCIAVEIFCLTCPIRHRTSVKFQFTCPEIACEGSEKEMTPEVLRIHVVLR